MKTPLQELIDYMNGEGSTVVPFVDEKVLIKATELLEKEREQIEGARKNGRESMLSSNSKIAFKTDEQYYNETYRQNK